MNRRSSDSLVAWGGQTASIGLGAVAASLTIRSVEDLLISQISV